MREGMWSEISRTHSLSHSNYSFLDIFPHIYAFMDSISFAAGHHAVVPRLEVGTTVYGRSLPCTFAHWSSIFFRAPAGAASSARRSHFSKYRRLEALRFASNGSTNSVPVRIVVSFVWTSGVRHWNFLIMKRNILEIEWVIWFSGLSTLILFTVYLRIIECDVCLLVSEEPWVISRENYWQERRTLNSRFFKLVLPTTNSRLHILNSP